MLVLIWFSCLLVSLGDVVGCLVWWVFLVFGWLVLVFVFFISAKLYILQIAFVLHTVLDALGSMPIFAEFRPEPFWSLALKKSEIQIIYVAPH